MKNELTKAELEILRTLWKLGASTVRQVNDEINNERDVNYTSTLKLMQIMHEKGILKRDASQMKHVYSPAEAEDKIKGNLLKNFVNTVYDGSPSKLVMQLMGGKKNSKEDLDAIREMLRKLDGK
ncbi:BlaI/MecI/CopY family transcriptional regulator [Sphingobacterium siyangense]|uniref:BlaI/MecI/CopY family transcriptional regulator n=1 Tax=Sphingobacterium siyangense TaxID=459529 RepID=UPI003DA37CA4